MDSIKITIDTNAEQASKTFDDLTKSFNKDTKAAEDLRKQIKGLKDDLYKLEPGTKEYSDTLQELGSKMNQLSDTQQELRVATGGLDTVFQSTTQATASLASGFTAAAGVISLFGGDAEDLQKTFVKLQAAMAIMNGLKGFASFGKMLNRAIISIRSYVTQTGVATAATVAEGAAIDKNTVSLAGNAAAVASNTAANTANVKSTTSVVTSYGKTSKAISENAARLRSLNSCLEAYIKLGNQQVSTMYKQSFAANNLKDMYNNLIAAHKAEVATSFDAGKKTAEIQQAMESTDKAATGLRATLNKLVTSIKSISSATVVAAGVLASVVAFMTYLWKESKKVKEQMEATAEVERTLADDTKKLAEKQADATTVFNKALDTYKKLGVKEEAITKITYNHYYALKKQAQAQYDAEIALAKYYSTSAAMNKEWEKHNKLAEEAAELLKEYEKVLLELDSVGVPDWMLKLNEQQQQFTRKIERAVNQGVITEGQGIQKNLDKAKEDLAELNRLLDDYYSGDFQRIQQANADAFKFGIPTLNDSDNVDAQLAIYEERVKYYTEKLEDYNDRMQKSMSQNASALQKKSAENLVKLNDGFQKEFDKLTAEYKSKMDAFSSLVENSDMDTETAQARLYQYQVDFEKKLNELMENQKKTASTYELTSNDLTSFVSNMKTQIGSFLKYMEGTDFPYPPEIHQRVIEMQQDMLKEAQAFATLNKSMETLVNEGKITASEYMDWLTSYIKGYKDKIQLNKDEGGRIIENVLGSMDITEEEKEKLRNFWSKLFDFSDNILPPETSKSIEASITKMIDKMFDDMKYQYELRNDEFSKWVAEQNRTWVEGGEETSYWGDSATTKFKKAQEQAQALYNLLHGEYTDEIALLEKEMLSFLDDNGEVLDEKSEAWAQYYAKIQELRQADADAQAAYETSNIANARQYSQDLIETVNTYGDKINGLASAMESYYHEQAEQAKEMYGENSDEYKKYLKKEGNMKIAQVWTDAATGIMSAWATSESLGPIAGPILAAIQTAALLATAAASTQQIKRQTNANASGGSTNANVSGITDRVVFGEAQNASQQAELNAQYSAGSQRVYVVEGDINDAQNSTRTAVTGNSF